MSLTQHHYLDVILGSDRKRPQQRRRIEDDDKDREEEEEERPLKRARRQLKRNASVAANAAVSSIISSQKSLDEADDSDDDLTPPKGRDFDLDQIRSELKGFEKAVKPPPTQSESSSESPDEKPTKTIEPSVSTDNKTIQQSTEDIYEFKEPEPFEFESGTRKLGPVSALTLASQEHDKQKKLRPQRSLFEDSPSPPPQISAPAAQSPKRRGGRSPPEKQNIEEQEPSPTRRRIQNTYRRKKSPEKEEPKIEDPFDRLQGSPSGGEPLPPLFRELGPSPGISISDKQEDDSSEDLGPEPPPFQNKDQPSAALDPIFRGFTQQTPPPISDKPPTTITSDEDDPIGAAIHRAMTHTLTDEDSSSDDLFMQPPPPIMPMEPSPCTIESKINPALQETDSRLMEVISQQTANLFKQDDIEIKEIEPVIQAPSEESKAEQPTNKPKIAETLLHKFSMIKKKEETILKLEPEEEPTAEPKVEPKPVEVKKEIKIEPKLEVCKNLCLI